MSDTPINLSVFSELQDAMGAEFVEELVSTFLEEAPTMLAEISSAVEKDDKDKYRRAAHSLKSNADIFGAQILVGMARKMELEGLGPDGNSTRISELNTAYDRAAAILKDLKDG